MGNARKRRRTVHAKKRARQHKLSMLGISGVTVMLAVVLMFGSASLKKKNEEYKAQEEKCQALLAEQEIRAQEIEDMASYVGQKEYVENVAKDKLGLAYPNEVLIKEQ